MSTRMPPYASRSQNHARADRLVQPVAEPDRLHDAADRAFAHQRQRLFGRRTEEAFREADREDAPGLAHGGLDRRELLERGHAGLVRHHVLAAAHRIDGNRGALARNGGGHDDLDGRIVEQSLLVGDFRQVGKALAKTRQHMGVGRLRTVTRTFHAGFEQVSRQIVRMPVFEADDGES